MPACILLSKSVYRVTGDEASGTQVGIFGQVNHFKFVQDDGSILEASSNLDSGFVRGREPNCHRRADTTKRPPKSGGLSLPNEHARRPQDTPVTPSGSPHT